MTDEEMISFVKKLVNEPRLDDLVPYYLDMAKSAVIAYIYPYRADATWQDVSPHHHGRTCEICVYLINRRGSEGEKSHSESGVSRTYSDSVIPASYFVGMIPHVGVPMSGGSNEES